MTDDVVEVEYLDEADDILVVVAVLLVDDDDEHRIQDVIRWTDVIELRETDENDCIDIDDEVDEHHLELLDVELIDDEMGVVMVDIMLLIIDDEVDELENLIVLDELDVNE